jgi:hypothetical protein
MRTNVRSALSDESIERRGFLGLFFGFADCGDESLSLAAALFTRPNKLARARWGSSPFVGGPLIPPAGLPLSPLVAKPHRRPDLA